MKQRISKILLIVLIMAMVFSLAGCPALEEAPAPTPTPTPTPDPETDLLAAAFEKVRSDNYKVEVEIVIDGVLYMLEMSVVGNISYVRTTVSSSVSEYYEERTEDGTVYRYTKNDDGSWKKSIRDSEGIDGSMIDNFLLLTRSSAVDDFYYNSELDIYELRNYLLEEIGAEQFHIRLLEGTVSFKLRSPEGKEMLAFYSSFGEVSIELPTVG